MLQIAKTKKEGMGEVLGSWGWEKRLLSRKGWEVSESRFDTVSVTPTAWVALRAQAGRGSARLGNAQGLCGGNRGGRPSDKANFRRAYLFRSGTKERGHFA